MQTVQFIQVLRVSNAAPDSTGKLMARPIYFKHQSVFQNGTSRLLEHGKRRRGRPRLKWASIVHAHSLAVAMSVHGGVLSPEEAFWQICRTDFKIAVNRQEGNAVVLRCCLN